jgi:hypothetical protein
MSLVSQNPWQRQGVSVIYENLADLIPLVGQESLFDKLCKFRDDILSSTRESLTGFFVLFGGWGVGKSRVGHEICLEAFADEVQWIKGGEPHRILEHGIQQGILPLFVRYVQITGGPLGAGLETENWISRVTVEALSRLAELRGPAAGSSAKNEDRILNLTRKGLRRKGWDTHLPQLREALKATDANVAARQALDVLKELGIEHLWVIVDEIEDITDVERDGLRGDRTGIDQALITIIPRVIKSEEARRDFPEVNFLLLCAQSVGDLLTNIGAIRRRTDWYGLTSNSFADVESLSQYLSVHRPKVAEAVSNYPKGLKEAAFFAANRNFGWFNVIMHHAHVNHSRVPQTTPQLLEKFAKDFDRGDGRSVFNMENIDEFHIANDADREEIVQAIFSLLPRSIAPDGEIPVGRAEHLLSKKDAAGRPLFTKLREIAPPQEYRILAHMINCGFRNPTGGNELQIPGEFSFNIKTVIDSLKAYSIALLAERRKHLLICEDESEFIDQIKGLTPYAERAADFAPFLHGLLTDSSYQVKGTDGVPKVHIGPAFSFLLDFNGLNASRRTETGFLRDSTKNTQLEEAFRQVQKDAPKRAKALLRGLANVWNMEKAPIPVTEPQGLKLLAVRTAAQPAPFNLGASGQATLIYAAGSSEADLDHDLTRLAQEPAAPVLLLLEDQDGQVEDLRHRLERNVPGIAPFVILHNITGQTASNLIRIGLMGDAFRSDDLRTSHFHAMVGTAKQHLEGSLKEWLEERIEKRGLVLKPLFLGSKVGEEQLRAFSKGYAAMLSGMNEHLTVQMTSGVFSSEAERDDFRKTVEKHANPGPKYQNDPRMVLIETNGAGEHVAVVPRAMISVLERCGPVAIQRGDLERRFLFELSEGMRPRDVIRHFTSVLHYVGLLEQDGEKLERISAFKLDTWVKRAKDWLDGDFKAGAEGIKAIHRDAGADLTDIRMKDARDKLKKAADTLGALSLDFIGKPWAELNEETSGGGTVYEERSKAAVGVVREVRTAVRSVFDPSELGAFRYSPDSLREYEAEAASLGYPLWKRLAVLRSFYSELEKRRKALVKRMDEVLVEVDKRVHELPSGEKAFPIQALTLPLSLYRQELNFGADRPEKTVSAGGSSFGVKTVGFKIASGHYIEAMERLDTIEKDLHQPGELVPAFLELLKTWEGLRKQVSGLQEKFGRVADFFSDAPLEDRKKYDISGIEGELADLVDLIEEGGIRLGTDSREDAGTPPFQLIQGLKDDLRKAQDGPRALQERLDGIIPSVVSSLEEFYSERYRYRMNAIARIRLVQGQTPSVWPDAAAETFGKTKAVFEDTVRRIEMEGETFFAGCGDTSFNTYVGFCQLELEKKFIDWKSVEHKRHRDVLMDKNLLTLKLV